MRLLADENISWRLKRLLPDWEILPANEIKTNLKLSDTAIWQYAKHNHYAILTFDEDFVEIQNLLGHPPKILWLRIGNTTTNEIALSLERLESDIKNFIANDEAGVLEIH